jgi:hypothetical protein
MFICIYQIISSDNWLPHIAWNGNQNFISLIVNKIKIIYTGIYIYTRLKIKPNSARIRFLSSQIFSSRDGIWIHTIDTLQHQSLSLKSSALYHWTTFNTSIYLYSIHFLWRFIVNNISMIFLISVLKIFCFLAFWGKKGKILTKISDFWKLILSTSFYLYSIHFLWRCIANNITMIFLYFLLLNFFLFCDFLGQKSKNFNKNRRFLEINSQQKLVFV